MIKLSIGNKLYLSVVSIFLIFAISFIVFQQNREKQYKIEFLNLRLQDYNDRMHVSLSILGKMDEKTLSNYVQRNYEKNIRVTLIRKDGLVFLII